MAWTGLDLYNAVRKSRTPSSTSTPSYIRSALSRRHKGGQMKNLILCMQSPCLCPPKKAVDERTCFSLCYLCYNRQFSLLIKIPGRQQKIRKLHAQPNAAECPIQCSHFPSTTSKLRHAKCHETTQKQGKEIMGSSNSHLVSG
jgi:hypothetical protein